MDPIGCNHETRPLAQNDHIRFNGEDQLQCDRIVRLDDAEIAEGEGICRIHDAECDKLISKLVLDKIVIFKFGSSVINENEKSHRTEIRNQNDQQHIVPNGRVLPPRCNWFGDGRR